MRPLALAGVVGLALALTACTGCSGDRDAARIAAAGENVRRTVIANDRVSGIDPLHLTGASGKVAVNIFETLFQYHYLKRPYVLVPLLAAAMPEISADGLTWTIRLRTDVRFEDDPAFPGGRGRALVAGDFVYSILRIADARHASGAWAPFAERVVGLDAWHAATMRADAPAAPPAEGVEGVRALDDHTLQIRLVRPWPQLGYVLAQTSAAPVAREVVDRYGADVMMHPVGTGPYRLATWTQDVEIILERSPSFRGEAYPSEGAPGDAAAGLLADAGKPMPFIDRLQFMLTAGGETLWLMFLAGEVDYSGTPARVFSEIVTPGRTLKPEWQAKGIASYPFESSFARWIGLNMADPLIGTNPPLRRAISHLLDRAEFNTTFLSARHAIARGIVPPVHRPADDGPPHPNVTFDLDQAKRDLAEAERVAGRPIRALKMLFGGKGGVQRQVGQLITRNFARVGITLEVEYVDEGAPYQRIAKERGAHLIFGVGYAAPYPDPIGLFARFYGPNVERGPNPFGYRNPAYDALFERASGLAGSPERDALYRQMEQILLDDLPAIPYLVYNHFFLVRDWLRNCKPHTFYGPSGVAKYHRIDTARRVAAARAGR